MSNRPWPRPVALLGLMVLTLFADVAAWAQLIDRTKAPNEAQEGIAKSLGEQIGAGRGTDSTPESSLYLIARDPFRTIRRGRQLFRRKSRETKARGPAWATAVGTSTSSSRSAREWPIAAPPVTAIRAARRASAVSSSPVPTAATLPTSSGSGSSGYGVPWTTGFTPQWQRRNRRGRRAAAGFFDGTEPTVLLGRRRALPPQPEKET